MSNVWTKMGWLSFREEGDVLAAYLAKDETTMDGAVRLGSIAIGAAVRRPDLEERFYELMRDVLSAAIAGALGEEAVFEEALSPEHKREGNA